MAATVIYAQRLRQYQVRTQHWVSSWPISPRLWTRPSKTVDLVGNRVQLIPPHFGINHSPRVISPLSKKKLEEILRDIGPKWTTRVDENAPVVMNVHNLARLIEFAARTSTIRDAPCSYSRGDVSPATPPHPDTQGTQHVARERLIQWFTAPS